MEIRSTARLRFACPACGGSECVSTAEGIGQLLDFPVVCSGCGAAARLRGAPAYFATLLATIAFVFWLYFGVVAQLFATNALLGYVAFGAMALGVGGAERLLAAALLRWELGQSERGPDETSLSRGLRGSWGYLVPAALFGPCVKALGGFHALPFPAVGLLFFGSLGTAMIPVITGRAPWSFWAVALALWFGGTAVFAIALA